MAEKIDLQEGIKPVAGAPSNFGQGTTIRKIDDQGRITEVKTAGGPLDTYNVKTAEELASPARMGDYYYDATRTLQPWENSPTDLLQKYKVAVGGTERPQETVSLANEGLGIAGGAAIGSIVPGVGTAVGALVGGLAGGLVAHNAAAEKALENWRNEDVKYDAAVEFYKDDDGQVKYKLDYQKMGTGGPRSGEGIKEAQTRETKVALGNDGRLKVTVSPIFATTARFQEMMDFISENYGGLSKDTENLDTILTEIRDGIDGETQRYVTNMKLYADFANRFPNAKPETIVASYVTEIAGYADPSEMSDYQMTVLDDSNNSQSTSAKDFFDSVLAKSKDDRNRLAEKLTNIVYGEGGYTDDQKAIAYGELQSLYAVSANTEGYEKDKYQSMMDADPVVSFLANFAPLGLNVGDALRFVTGGNFMNTNQEYLNQNDFAVFLGGSASIGAGFGLWKGGTKLTEGLLKLLPGTSQLFQASISGKGTEALAWIAQNFNRTGTVAKAWVAEGLFKTLKVGLFDAALAGSQAVVSGKDFWAEFGQDFARDAALEALFSYYDMVSFQKSVSDSVVLVYQDPSTGNLVKLNVPKEGTIPERVFLGGDGSSVDETFTSIGESGKPEEFVRDASGAGVYYIKGKANIAKTRTGDTVAVYQDPNMTGIMYNGKVIMTYSEGSNGESILLPSGDIGIDEFPALSTGVVETSQMSGDDLVKYALDGAGLPKDTMVMEMPSASADAAVMAGKVASVQGSKFGLSVYKNLFNKNAMLDVVNNLALAKTGDQNSWREAQENFVSVTNNAQRELQNIQNGVYVKEAAAEWGKTIETMGNFNYQYKYKSKVDGAYINAINQLQRAQLLNNSRVEGDTTDYVAKALEKYGDTIASIPPDRAEALQTWLEQGKKWLKVFNRSVIKSGKIDPEKLENLMDTDIDSEIGYFPVWGKKKTYNELLSSFYGLSRKRNPYKEWLRNGEWVPLSELEDPYVAMDRYMSAVANNMGLNDMIESAAVVLDQADLLVDNTPSEATVRRKKLESIKNKDELKKKLDELVEAKKKEVKEKTLTPKQYKDMMVELYEQSAIPEISAALSGVRAPENWNEFWENAPVQTRKDIRNELEKTSLQTGYGISDTRARLNAQVPGFDVLDWSLLSREHTDGLYPGGLYSPLSIGYNEDYQKGLQADSSMAGRIQESYRGALAQRLIKEASRVVGLAEDYLGPYAWGFDVESYLNTGLIPDLQMALNKKMLPEEFNSFVQARMEQAIRDAAPYQSPEMVLKSQLENVAQDWRDWAVKHIKSGRATSKELREFAGSHNLDLPKDKRPIGAKIKHALWEMIQNDKALPKIEGLDKKTISKGMEKEDFYKLLDSTPLFQSAVKDKNELVDLVAAEINGETTDAYEMGAAAEALEMGERAPLTWYKGGKPYTRFIKTDTEEHKRWANEILSTLYDKELIKKPGMIDKIASGAANDFRLLTTGWDPSRPLPNLTRDTTRSFIVGPRFIQAKKTLQAAIEMGNYTPKQKENLMRAIENAAESAKNSSYNSAYRTPKRKQVAITKEYLSKNGASPMKRFWYNVAHDKRSIAEFPMEFFEGFSRRQNALSLAAVQLGKDQRAGKSYKEQLENAVTAANFAGREYTANFQRKGKIIEKTSKYVAYQSSKYAGLDGMMRAFIDNPKLVSRNFAVFVIAYLLLLGDTLSREETRRQYYRLSEYDRENQIVIGMGDSILTIPMDQELAGLLFPYRRIMETLNGTDPVSFFEFIWGTLTEAMPMDLSGFSEDGGFNLSRGLQKLAAENMPTVLTPIQEAATGYDLYYGNDISVTDEELKNYGIYGPEAGDYTTSSKDSAFLRSVANATGIPQWQLQTMWEGYGGNVGKYILNIIDKAAGATKEQQGGKDFADTVFNSFTALDQDAAASKFYDGIKQLQGEKGKLLQKIANYNEDLKVASGDAKVELQNKIQKAKEEYGIKVGDFVDQYVNAYDITGGLPKSQAQQIYYLFRLDDDDTLYEVGSIEEYYNNQAKQQLKNQATALSAPVLDRYYNNRIGNIYQDTDGVWRQYLSGGAQAMRNSIYGYGEQQKVDLLNILEGKDSNLVSYRTQIKNARNKAYEAKDWDTYNALGYELDKKVIEAISPYIEKYGAENVLGNSQVLNYLADWFIVPDEFKRTKNNRYVSLAHNASSQEAFVRPFIKYVFGLPTNYYSYSETKLNAPLIGGQGE